MHDDHPASLAGAPRQFPRGEAPAAAAFGGLYGASLENLGVYVVRFSWRPSADGERSQLVVELTAPDSSLQQLAAAEQLLTQAREKLRDRFALDWSLRAPSR